MKNLFVLFGGTGDLSRRYVLPAIAQLNNENFKKHPIDILLIGRRDWSDDDLKNFLQEAEKEFGYAPFSNIHVEYLKMDITLEKDYQKLKERIDVRSEKSPQNILYYLALSPNFFPGVTKSLASHDLHIAKKGKRKIVLEKPFGESLVDATKLNIQIQEVFDESQIYRIDHYLGKNYVQELQKFRLKQKDNWYAERIKSIHVIANEELTVLDRGEFYDKNGAIKDYLQNHLIQILAIAAMRYPHSLNAEDIRDRKMQLLHSISAFLIDPRQDILLGQYEGYKEENGVDPNSRTETFVRVKMYIDDPLWKDVEVILQTGKGLEKKESKVDIEFRDGEKMTFEVNPENINNSYEKLLGDAFNDDQTLFVRWDSVKAAWVAVNELIHCTDNCPLVYSYPIGSNGPKL